MKPTAITYAELQLAYDTFNRRLFNNELPECLITLQRSNTSVGYFSADRFSNLAGQKIDEIAMNPTYFAVVPLVEIMQTVAHEMTHLWQHHFGDSGRGRYHNAQWAKKMESIGLMPSSTGQPDGNKTGDSIADYPIEGGQFIQACEELLTNDFKISWYDRFAPVKAIEGGQHCYGLNLDLPEAAIMIAASSGVEIVHSATPSIRINASESTPNKTNRSKYTCPCDLNVWGKPGLNIQCGSCGGRFSENL
ncbi:SprT-like domain-containing protein [Methylomonas sp. AM2-LC]|uniref:SprT-like domain-containing protein n=1 Tax=Methylomonas sp. AM2-LC TaxID=3153301 RepID=UPI0032635111